MARPYKKLRERVRIDEARTTRVAAHRQAMEDALALSEIRAKRELTQNDIAKHPRDVAGERVEDRAPGRSLPLDPGSLRRGARWHTEGRGDLR